MTENWEQKHNSLSFIKGNCKQLEKAPTIKEECQISESCWNIIFVPYLKGTLYILFSCVEHIYTSLFCVHDF